MTIDQQLCDELTQAQDRHRKYVEDAIRVAGAQRLPALPGSRAQAVVRFEVIHVDALSRRDLADACAFVETSDLGIRFVAPDVAAADNYVSYWHNEATNGKPVWTVLAPGQRSDTNQVFIVGQTLPAQLAAAGGAGYLAFNPLRPSDGWTVNVGVERISGEELGDVPLQVTVSARPDWTPQTAPVPLAVPTSIVVP